MDQAPADKPGLTNRGAVTRLFGVILIILGWLNTMLSWRGGFEIVPFHAALIGVGVLLCLIGAVRRQRHLDQSQRMPTGLQ